MNKNNKTVIDTENNQIFSRGEMSLDGQEIGEGEEEA